MRLVGRASLVPVLLLCWLGAGSPAEIGWVVSETTGEPTGLIYGAWADCRREAEARTRAARRLVKGLDVLPEIVPAYVCLPRRNGRGWTALSKEDMDTVRDAAWEGRLILATPEQCIAAMRTNFTQAPEDQTVTAKNVVSGAFAFVQNSQTAIAICLPHIMDSRGSKGK